MAIALDSSAANAYTNASSATLSFTCSGSNRILFVGVNIYNTGAATDVLTGITYNGVAMTQVTKLNFSGPNTLYLYYIINPTLGANNIVVSLSVSVTNIDVNAISYTGAKQSSVPDAYNTGNTGSSPLTISVTTIADNCWLVGVFNATDGSALSAGTGTTLRTASNIYSKMGDSNGPKSPAGSYSLQVSSATGYPVGITASFAPVLPTNSNFLMFM